MEASPTSVLRPGGAARSQGHRHSGGGDPSLDAPVLRQVLVGADGEGVGLELVAHVRAARLVHAQEPFVVPGPETGKKQ